MRIRLVETRDSESIRNIYNTEVLETSNTLDMVPRSIEDQERWLQRHQGAHPAVVAVSEPGDPSPNGVDLNQIKAGSIDLQSNNATVIGFGSLSPYRDRPAYATTAENSIYVHRDYRGNRVGKAILQELLVLAGKHGFHSVIARVVGNNIASINLHRSCGFTLVGIENEVGRKHGHWLDIVELQRLL